ncbi:YqaA family protein [Govanella unica]|uniref:DedA family protein n=1 Tax=Govanella unica TaxID=2975056 RepID=A0A9X3Z652_9PROT|nr:YqaA family protein [Govania unica]MDA5192648.1 DedA family protein [Govania unica]
MFRRLYEWVLEKSRGPRAPHALAVISFAESSFFPIPPDVMLVPMTLSKPERWASYARICTIASVIGGVVGYAIGALLFDTLGMHIVRLYGLEHQMEGYRQAYAEWGTWLILIKGVTPIPYKLVTIASGFSGYDFFAFMGLSLITRGARFYGITWLTKRYGSHVAGLLERRVGLVATLVLGAIVLGFVAVKFIL